MTHAPSSQANFVRLSGEIVSAYVCRNAVPTASLPELIAAVHAALGTLVKPAAIIALEPMKPSPAEIRLWKRAQHRPHPNTCVSRC